ARTSAGASSDVVPFVASILGGGCLYGLRRDDHDLAGLIDFHFTDIDTGFGRGLDGRRQISFSKGGCAACHSLPLRRRCASTLSAVTDCPSYFFRHGRLGALLTLNCVPQSPQTAIQHISSL